MHCGIVHGLSHSGGKHPALPPLTMIISYNDPLCAILTVPLPFYSPLPITYTISPSLGLGSQLFHSIAADPIALSHFHHADNPLFLASLNSPRLLSSTPYSEGCRCPSFLPPQQILYRSGLGRRNRPCAASSLPSSCAWLSRALNLRAVFPAFSYLASLRTWPGPLTLRSFHSSSRALSFGLPTNPWRHFWHFALRPALTAPALLLHFIRLHCPFTCTFFSRIGSLLTPSATPVHPTESIPFLRARSCLSTLIAFCLPHTHVPSPPWRLHFTVIARDSHFALLVGHQCMYGFATTDSPRILIALPGPPAGFTHFCSSPAEYMFAGLTLQAHAQPMRAWLRYTEALSCSSSLPTKHDCHPWSACPPVRPVFATHRTPGASALVSP